jgi:negative regulator of flagellin synthesis FlgM
MSSIETSSRKTFFPPGKRNDLGNSNVANVNPIKTNSLNRKNALDKLSKENVKVSISDSIKDFSFIKKAVDQAPEKNNSEKIARLKDQINRGVYKVDYDALANKIIEEELY